MSEKKFRMYEGQPAGSLDLLSEFEQVEKYVSSFEEPARNLVEQLKENIEADKYRYIVGIDAAGRIPALIIGEYISKLNLAEGREVPKRLFAGPNYTESSSPQLRDLFEHAGALREADQKVLIIDDTIFKGNSLLQATEAFRRCDIPFDIGIFLAINNDDESIERFRIALGADHLYVGDHTVYVDEWDGGEIPHPIIKRRDLIGVQRAKQTEGKSPSPISEVQIPDKYIFRIGREQVSVLVDELLESKKEN